MFRRETKVLAIEPLKKVFSQTIRVQLSVQWTKQKVFSFCFCLVFKYFPLAKECGVKKGAFKAIASLLSIYIFRRHWVLPINVDWYLRRVQRGWKLRKTDAFTLTQRGSWEAISFGKTSNKSDVVHNNHFYEPLSEAISHKKLIFNFLFLNKYLISFCACLRHPQFP